MSELWYVKLPDGDVEPLTLDELDEAFQAGSIDPSTMVLAAGASEWAMLGELAGLDQPVVQRPVPVTSTVPPRSAFDHAPAQPETFRPLFDHASSQPVPYTLRPLSVDLGVLGEEDEAFAPKRKSKKWVFGVVLVAGVLGFAAFEAQRSGALALGRLSLGRLTVAALQTAHPPPPAAAPAPPPAPEPIVPTPAPPAASPATNALTDVSNRFSPEVKEKLAAADKLREQKAKAHQKARAPSGAPASGAKRKSQDFTTGGSKFDPLNATIP